MGGVIGCYAINYDSAEKGGAHDAYQNACGSACVSADGHLAFGTLDALAEFCGRACEYATEVGIAGNGALLEYRYYYGARSILYEPGNYRVNAYNNDLLRKLCDIGSDEKACICLPTPYLGRPQYCDKGESDKWNLVELEGSILPPLDERKEVAYVAD